MTGTPRKGDVDLDALEALAKAATPGPWAEGGYGGLRMDRGREGHEVIGSHDGERWPRVANCREGNRNGRENAEYIAAANPSTVLALIERLREAEKRADESALRSIEARNPGIDMAEVRRTFRAGQS